MRKLVISIIFVAFLANVSAQLKVESSGDTYISKNVYLQSASNFIGTTGNFPITFKVNNTLFAGATGSGSNNNVSFGYEALRNNPSSGANTAIGYQALYNNASTTNTAVGYQALYNSTSSTSVAIGYQALYGNTQGNNNTAVGFLALNSNTTGYNNTAIGSFSSCGSTLNNATAIGHFATATASNSIFLGNSSVANIYLGGVLTHHSDGRIKKNIRAEVPGLAFINQLQPVMYNYDLDALDELQKSDDPKFNALRDSLLMARSSEEKAIDAKARADKEKIVYSGFIAQDVEKAAQSVNYDFNGIDVPKDGKGVYGLGYAEFVVPLVKAVQELSEQNARLQEQINELKEKSFLRSVANETETTGIIDPVIAQCKLYQNTPNPFNQETEIKYYLPQEIKTAFLCIYNLQGTQIKQVKITQRGEDSQWISGSELNAGMYLYALIVDGKEVDTKRMILTK